MSQTVLVAGGAGYIGSHVAWALHRAGYTPVVIDNLSTGHRWAVRWGDLVEGDIGDEALIAATCARYNPVALMNFAAFSDVAGSMADPDSFFDNNVKRAERLFAAAQKSGVRHIVFSSTAAVYGIPGPDGKVTEDMKLHPANPYGQSKIMAENALRALSSAGVTSMVLRYFNAAGAAPPDAGIGEAHWPETNLLPRALLAALGHENPLQLFGDDYDTPDGTACRDFIHVCDLADAHLAALDYLLKGGASDICNLGTGNGYSVRQVIAGIERHLNRPVPLRIAPRRAGDVAVMLADSSRAARALGWTARYGLDDMIASAAVWHQGDLYRALLPELQHRAAPGGVVSQAGRQPI